LNAGEWVRRVRLVMVAPDTRHPRRFQAEIPLIELSKFGQPPLTLIQAGPKPQDLSCQSPGFIAVTGHRDRPCDA
jgi:hypothetical protein